MQIAETVYSISSILAVFLLMIIMTPMRHISSQVILIESRH